MKPPVPKNDRGRIAALHRYKILDTAPEESFDRITRIAAAYLDVPIALVSLVDESRQWFKSRYGLDATETPWDLAFCAHAITGDELLVVADATRDARFENNPLVTGNPGIRLYAGAPLRTADGFRLGTLCVIDIKPKNLTEDQKRILADLGSLVIDLLELRRATADAMAYAKAQELSSQEIRDKEARFSAVVETVVDGIITIDERGTVDSFNPAAELIFGFAEEEIIGRNIKDLMPAPYRGEHDGYLERYRETGNRQIIGIGREVEGLRKDGTTFPLELAVSEMQVAGQRMFTGIVRDVTERKRMERMKSEFVSTVSHELRTPLTSIKGSLGLIRAGAVGDIPGKPKAMLEIAYKNSDRLVHLINDILDMEKIEAGKMDFHLKPVDVTAIVEHALEANKGYGDEHGVTFALKAMSPVAMIEGDEDRLMQVLSNLMSNAAKYSPEGAQVDISVTPHGDSVRISVTDRGPGIPKEFKARIFEKFSQADSSDTRQKGGTGLGLSITKAIVEQHGGTIGFETKAGKGSTFYFDLPMCDEPAVDLVEPRQRVGRYRILVCESEPDIATLLDIMLRQSGFDTEIARSAGAAKEMLAQGGYDAMTLDLGLPDQDGLSLIKELRDEPRTRNLPVVVISARASETKDIVNGDAIGIIDWIQKPIDHKRLQECVRLAVRNADDSKPCILHIEDDDDIVQVVTALVGDNASVTAVSSVAAARRLLQDTQFDLVILDLVLPDGRGEDLLPLMRRPGFPATPVIVFSAKEQSEVLAHDIENVLVKSQTSNEDLLDAIHSVIHAIKTKGNTNDLAH